MLLVLLLVLLICVDCSHIARPNCRAVALAPARKVLWTASIAVIARLATQDAIGDVAGDVGDTWPNSEQASNRKPLRPSRPCLSRDAKRIASTSGELSSVSHSHGRQTAHVLEARNYLSIYLSIYLSTYLPICLSVCLI